jgi:DNA-binding FrmR family transcriptional regulator
MIIPPFVGQPVVAATSGLADERGYVPVHDTYQSTAYPNIYAVGIAPAVTVPWTTAVPVGVPKTGFPTEAQAHVAAANIAAQIRGQRPAREKKFGDIPAVCVLDAGNNGVMILVDKMLPPCPPATNLHPTVRPGSPRSEWPCGCRLSCRTNAGPVCWPSLPTAPCTTASANRRKCGSSWTGATTLRPTADALPTGYRHHRTVSVGGAEGDMRVSGDTMSDVVKRLRRAEGQIRGVIGMLEAGRDCADVVTQLAAVSRALDRAGFRVIASGLQDCRAEQSEGNKTADLKQMEKLFLSLA